MSKITVSNKQRVVDHSYSLSSDKIKNIIWFDDETGEYCWIVYDTTKSEHTEMVDKVSPGMLTLGGRLR